MDDVKFKELYGLSDKDKQDLIKRVSQDITWGDDELTNDETLDDGSNVNLDELTLDDNEVSDD